MSLFSPLILIVAFQIIPGYCTSLFLHHGIENDGSNLILSPHMSSDGKAILYTLDHKGIFHRGIPAVNYPAQQVTYSVLKNGILVVRDGPYGITYKINQKGDLVPSPANTCIYKSDKPAYYLEGIDKMLIPVEIVRSVDHIYCVQDGKRLLYSEELDSSFKSTNMIADDDSSRVDTKEVALVPDQSCEGDIILFLLKSNGVLARNPPDEFIPNGMELKYNLLENGALVPRTSKKGLGFTYITSANGNLLPCSNNTHTLTALRETTKSFILGQGGVIAPVNELIDLNKTVQYFFDGKLVHSSNQFRQIFSNSSVLVLSENDKERNDTAIESIQPGPKFVCPKKQICRRDTTDVQRDASKESAEVDFKRKQLPEGRCPCAFDETGRRIPLEPFFFESGTIALYKLTCKGHLKRLVSYKEPECNFQVDFKLQENLMLVPVKRGASTKNKFIMRYTLQEYGHLIPVPRQNNTLKKAPASMIYYLLCKNRDLVPVRLLIEKNNEIHCYFQDILIFTIPADMGKEMELFTTAYVPLYAYVNSRIVVGYFDPVPKACNGATWSNPDKSIEETKCPSKKLYLIGPKGTKTLISPYISDHGIPVVYEMDCNGVCHRSPKDDSKTMVFKCYKLLKEGIMVPCNGSKGYMYLVDKLGNMCPYYFPETKLRACFGQTIKYVQCEDGILLPCLIRIYGDYLQYCFEDVVIYCKRTWTIEQILELQCEKKPAKTQEEIEMINLFTDKNGNIAYYEKCGDIIKRQPPQKVDNCLIHSIGYYLVSPSGILVHTEFPDEKSDYMQVMIEKEGNLKILSTSPKKAPNWNDYLMDKDGNLIPVEIKRKANYIKFYRNGVRIYKQNVDNWEIKTESDKTPKEVDTPSGSDPLGLLNDPPPPKCKNPKDEAECVRIPMKEVSFGGKSKCQCADTEKCKCDQMKKTIKDIMSKQSGANLEVEIPDEMVHEICQLANKCSCMKSRSKRSPRKCSRRRKVPDDDKSC